MPQVDLETLVCGGGGSGEGRVACETLIGSGEGPPDQPPAEDPDLPAESFQMRIGDEIDWTDLNPVYDRDDSTKGNTNPKSQHSNQTKTRSNSQRFSGNLKPKTPILGLPGKIQPSGYIGHSARRPHKGRIFEKGATVRIGGGGKAAVVEPEPASPKVSCIGKVLSERERERCRRARRSSADKAEERGGGGGGCWAGLFRCFGSRERRAAVVECVEESPAPRTGKLGRSRAAEKEAATAETPGLGGMKRFASGRKPASWGGDVDFEPDGHAASSRSLDPELAWGRRSLGSLEDAERDRDRESEGSASV